MDNLTNSIMWGLFNIMTIWPLIFIATWLYIMYYAYKLNSYLKENRVSTYHYLMDLPTTLQDRINPIGRYRKGLHWYFSNMDEDDERIRYYKRKIRTPMKLEFILIIFLILLLTTFTILVKLWN